MCYSCLMPDSVFDGNKTHQIHGNAGFFGCRFKKIDFVRFLYYALRNSIFRQYLSNNYKSYFKTDEVMKNVDQNFISWLLTMNENYYVLNVVVLAYIVFKYKEDDGLASSSGPLNKK